MPTATHHDFATSELGNFIRENHFLKGEAGGSLATLYSAQPMPC